MSYEDFDDDEFDAVILAERTPDEPFANVAPNSVMDLRVSLSDGFPFTARVRGCGTYAGAEYHRAHDEPVDDLCQAAYLKYHRDWMRANRKSRAKAKSVDLEEMGR